MFFFLDSFGWSLSPSNFINNNANEFNVNSTGNLNNNNANNTIGLHPVFSLYTGMNFACLSEIIKLINFAVKIDVEKSEKCKMIKDYIDKKYPIFKTIDISNISINNVWNMLDMYRKRYGNKFLLQNIQ